MKKFYCLIIISFLISANVFGQVNLVYLIAPNNRAIDIDLETKLSWFSTMDFSHFQLSLDSTFNTLIYNDSSIRGDSIKFSGLSDSTLYYWRVRGKAYNIYTEWSNIWYFRTIGKTPRLLTPPNYSPVCALNISLDWANCAAAISYRLQISTDSLFNSIVIDKDEITSNSSGNNLDYNTKYYWRIGAKNINDQIYWSDYWTLLTFSSAIATFPLDIGNKWFYQGSSTKNGNYKVIMQVTDSLNNGFKVVTSKYYYQDSITIITKYWRYIDGKLYINTAPSYTYYPFYNDFLQHDTCYDYASPRDAMCQRFVVAQIFGTSVIGQIHLVITDGHILPQA